MVSTTHLEKASAEIRGEFYRPHSRVNFAVDFLVDFLGPFSLEIIGGKNPPKNPRKFSNQNLGVSGPKSKLQGSGLDNAAIHDFSDPIYIEYTVQIKNECYSNIETVHNFYSDTIITILP